MFDYLRYAYGHAASELSNRPGLSLIAWLGYGTAWTCGSCFNTTPVTEFEQQFQSQIWYDATLGDERWWSDAVTAHELGHWVMASYGLPPGEGGTHCFGVPGFPGLAWSEGWATWHSSDVRSSSVYYDKQQGTMFYWDINSRMYSSNIGMWLKPAPSLGLIQLMDENEVSAMLWSISSASTSAPLYQALASPRMTSRFSSTPTPRGYTRRTWTLDPACSVLTQGDTGIPAPFVADMLDALECGGVPSSTIDNATSPSSAYPFPSASALCQAPDVPVVAMLKAEHEGPDGITFVARIEHRSRYPLPVEVSVRLPRGAALVSGKTAWVVPPKEAPGVDEQRFVIRRTKQTGEVVLVADAKAPGFGLHAERRWPEAKPVATKTTSRPFQLGKLKLSFQGEPLAGSR